jgi:hypothetical protein
MQRRQTRETKGTAKKLKIAAQIFPHILDMQNFVVS